MGDPSKLSPGFYYADKSFGFIIFKNKSKNTLKKRLILNKSSSDIYVKFDFLYKLYFLIC